MQRLRGLAAPACGVVDELCTQLLVQCSCLPGLQSWQQQQQLQHPSWNSSSSQHPLQFQQQRQKHTVRMVLLKDHKHLGKQGDIVEVKAGHARQTLFPSGQADYAIPSVIEQLKARGRLSAQALQQLQLGSRKAAAAGQVDPSLLPPQQQLQQIIKLLSKQPLVISRRFSLRQADKPMVGAVTARHLCWYAAKQLQIDLPRELIMMTDDAPITQFGSYKVPLNLKGSNGQQLELSVQVNQSYRSPGLRRIKLWAQQQGLRQPTESQKRWLKGLGQQQQQQQEQEQAPPPPDAQQEQEEQQQQQSPPA